MDKFRTRCSTLSDLVTMLTLSDWTISTIVLFTIVQFLNQGSPKKATACFCCQYILELLPIIVYLLYRWKSFGVLSLFISRTFLLFWIVFQDSCYSSWKQMTYSVVSTTSYKPAKRPGHSWPCPSVARRLWREKSPGLVMIGLGGLKRTATGH